MIGLREMDEQQNTALLDDQSAVAYLLAIEAATNLHNGKPYVIGITGAGGAGKSTFAEELEKRFRGRAVAIDLDHYNLPRTVRKKRGYKTAYQPEAIELHRANSDISLLLDEEPIHRPTYDRENGGVRGEPVRVDSKPVIILEGVAVLYPQVSPFVDFSYFFHSEPENQLATRLKRDVHERGIPEIEVRKSFPDFLANQKKYIDPTRDSASAIWNVSSSYDLTLLALNARYEQLMDAVLNKSGKK